MDVEGYGRLESLEFEVQSSHLASRAWRKAVSQSETSSQTSATLGCICSSTTPVDIAGSDVIVSIHSQVERVLSCCGTPCVARVSSPRMIPGNKAICQISILWRQVSVVNRSAQEYIYRPHVQRQSVIREIGISVRSDGFPRSYFPLAVLRLRFAASLNPSSVVPGSMIVKIIAHESPSSLMLPIRVRSASEKLCS